MKDSKSRRMIFLNGLWTSCSRVYLSYDLASMHPFIMLIIKNWYSSYSLKLSYLFATNTYIINNINSLTSHIIKYIQFFRL